MSIKNLVSSTIKVIFSLSLTAELCPAIFNFAKAADGTCWLLLVGFALICLMSHEIRRENFHFDPNINIRKVISHFEDFINSINNSPPEDSSTIVIEAVMKTLRWIRRLVVVIQFLFHFLCRRMKTSFKPKMLNPTPPIRLPQLQSKDFVAQKLILSTWVMNFKPIISNFLIFCEIWVFFYFSLRPSKSQVSNCIA